MPVVTDLNAIPSISHPCALSIGSFDGVHRGHQKLIHILKTKTQPSGTAVVLTFTTHPSTLFHPENPTQLILPIDKRLQLLLDYGVDLVIAIPFTHALANTPFDTFLSSLKQHLPFDYLILGQGAVLGHKRQGTEERIRQLCPLLHFAVEYIEKETNISSQEIRRLIQAGKLQQVEQALGRSYTVD